MLIGVVGLNGSGKDTFAKYLVDHYNFMQIDLGKEIREELKRRNKNYLDRNEMINLANEIRHKFGPNYWCKSAIDKSNSKNLVITSLRNPAEIEEIKVHGGVIIQVFANAKVRFKRTVARIKKDPSSHGDIKSFEEFITMEQKELENTDPDKQQLLECISMAEYKIDNNGSIKQLDKEIEALLSNIGIKD